MKAAENAVILWQGWLDLNQRMRESKSLALPLGYTPIREKKGDRDSIPDPALFVGWVKGLEPSTPGTTIRCSNQLSYTHHISGITREASPQAALGKMVRQKGFEPPAYCLEGSCSILLSYWRKWMEQVTGIEPASPAWKAGALAIVLHPRLPPEEIVSLVIIPFWKNFVNINSEKTAIFFTESRRSHPGSPAPDPDPPAAGHRA